MRVKANVPVEVKLLHGVPVEFTWCDTDWRVIDEPTPLRRELEWLHPLITHAPDAPRIGWRFTARCTAQDEVRTFDVLERGSSWMLQNAWD